MRCRLLLYIFALGVVPFPASPVCSVPQPRLVCAEYFDSEVVVEATLIRTSIAREKDDPDGIAAHIYHMRVNRLLRGKLETSFRVYEANSSGRAAFDWQKGHKYVLFLFHSPEHMGWSLDGCGNSGPLEETRKLLGRIEEINNSWTGGVIHGVVSEQAHSNGIHGARVEALSKLGHYTARTDSRGKFRITVPAGTYSLRAFVGERELEEADLSYGHRRRIRIEPGGCAQIQFAAAPSKEARPTP